MRDDERNEEGGERELRERIEGLENGLKRLSENMEKTASELRETVSALRDAIIDIRSAVSEIGNAVDVLRAITTERDLEGITRLKGVHPVLRAEPQEERAGEGDAQRMAPPTEGERRKMVHPEPVRGRFAILRWIWSLLDRGLEPEDVNSLSEYCEHMGYLPSGSSLLVSKLTQIVERARTKGMSVEELILNIYGAAAASGIALAPEDAVEAVFDAIRHTTSSRCR